MSTSAPCWCLDCPCWCLVFKMMPLSEASAGCIDTSSTQDVLDKGNALRV